jgi:division protein CdvB (Snf7/Vps24/ESCRT-III family)
VDYKSLVAQLMTERNRLDRAISLLQTLDEEQS